MKGYAQMSIKIAIANQKGGVGKTTTAINIADALTHLGHKVLFIDMDPQCNSTSTYGAKIENENTIVDVLKKDCTAKEAIQSTPLGDIIPGDTLLAQEKFFFNSHKAREFVLKKAMSGLEDEYDYIIMDTPPDLDIYMINALTFADGIIIPLTAAQYSVDGLGLLIETANDVIEELNPNLKIYGVVLNIYDARTKLDRDVFDSLEAVGDMYGFKAFRTAIRICQPIKEVQSIRASEEDVKQGIIPNRSLFENYPRCNAAVDYVNLVKEIMEVI